MSENEPQPQIRQTRTRRPYLPPSQLPGEALRREMQPEAGISPVHTGMMIILTLIAAGAIFLVISGLQGNPTPVTLPAIIANAATATPVVTLPPTEPPRPTPMDSDGDGIPDMEDNCILTANPTQSDSDNDGLGDSCDADRDNDRIDNEDDNCPDVRNIDQADSDNDEIGDACDIDVDGDNIPNEIDNCPDVGNPLQNDSDGDDIGDLCDEATELNGVTITTDGNIPLYIGSVDNNLLLSLEFDETPAAGLDLELLASDGTLHSAAMTCDTPGTGTLITSVDTEEFRYCPPEAALDITITARLRDAAGDITGVGGQITLESTFDNLSMVLEQAQVLNRRNEENSDDETRCYFTDPAGEFELEAQGIPLTFRVETDNPGDSGRSYPVALQIPPDGLYIAEKVDDVCGLLTTFDPLQDEATFNAEINRTYTFYYRPQSEITLNVLSLRAFIPGVPVAPQVVNISPLVVADTGLNVRNEGGDVVLAIQANDRAIATGIAGEGDGQWLRIKVDNDPRDLWLNIGLLDGSYDFIADASLIEAVELPGFVDSSTSSGSSDDADTPGSP